MAINRVLIELLQAPIEGYGDAIVIPAILVKNFELKVGLLQLVTSSQFHGFKKDNPQLIVPWGRPRNLALKRNPLSSIHTWGRYSFSKFREFFFPPSKTTNLKNGYHDFQQKFDETFSEAWDHFKDLIRKFPQHSFSKLHQIDTFYNALTQSDQDSLNAAAGGNLLNRTPRDALMIIENKSKCLATDSNTFNASAATGSYNQGGAGNSFVYDPNPNSFNDPPNFFNHPPHPQQYSCELCGNDSHYGFDCPPRISLVYEQEHATIKTLAANLSTYTAEPSRRFKSIYDDEDDDEESTIPLNEIIFELLSSIAITTVLSTMEPEDPLIMGDENLSTIPEKESDEFIKSIVEDLVPIPCESEDTSDNDSACDLPFCDDSPPLDILGGNFVTFSNPLFDANDDFTSSDDESLPEEDVQEENFKIYSNSLFEFDDKYISSDVNPLFNEVLEGIESKDSYVSNFDESALLVTPLSDANEDECFDPRGDINEIDAFLDIDVSTDFEDDYYDSEGDTIYLEGLLFKETIPNLPPEVFLDHDPRSLKG
ncbi:abscisic aldehyde oxidase 3 [Tanacetum coccineum]